MQYALVNALLCVVHHRSQYAHFRILWYYLAREQADISYDTGYGLNSVLILQFTQIRDNLQATGVLTNDSIFLVYEAVKTDICIYVCVCVCICIYIYTKVSENFPASNSRAVQEDIIIIIIICYHPSEKHLRFIAETNHVRARVYSVAGILWLRFVLYVI